MSIVLDRAHELQLPACASGLVLGAVAWLGGRPELAHPVWIGTTLVVLVSLSISTVRRLARAEFGVDVIALLAMGSALAVGENLAAAIVALMMTGGQTLERRAGARARRELSALLALAPRVAHRRDGHEVTTLDAAGVEPGDRLLVKPGEIVPVDGVACGIAVLDESALTGEAIPVLRREDDPVRSGVLNAGGAFDLRATATSANSSYAAVVRLVEAAVGTKPPFVRLADRYAMAFLVVTAAVAACAWALSGDARRAVAVLVVATPCPLILAVPIAIVSGMSRAARRGVLIKGGAALDALAGARTLLLDKTGTITAGALKVSAVVALREWEPDEVLRLAASLDQVSPHVFAAAIVQEARHRGLRLVSPDGVEESPGEGIRGRVDQHVVRIGGWNWTSGNAPVSSDTRHVRRRSALDGASLAYVAVDDLVAGVILLHDPIRPDAARAVRAMRRAGIRRVVLVTGDHHAVAGPIAAGIGADALLAERSPAEKVEAVRAERAHALTVMVGDGVNDAPALAAAHVGIAMGARGTAASCQAADVVLTLDRFDRVAEALEIARATRRVALQSLGVGMGLSLAAMGFASAGLLPPVLGAVAQEAIDLVAILSALRARRAGPGERAQSTPDVLSGQRFRAEHLTLIPEVDTLCALADRLEVLPPGRARKELIGVREFLEVRLAPHEVREDVELYQAVARRLGGDDPTAAMSRAHLEIAHLIRLYGRLLDDLPAEGLEQADIRDLRRILYGLHAVLKLHFAQEEEFYLPLFEEARPPSGDVSPSLLTVERT